MGIPSKTGCSLTRKRAAAPEWRGGSLPAARSGLCGTALQQNMIQLALKDNFRPRKRRLCMYMVLPAWKIDQDKGSTAHAGNQSGTQTTSGNVYSMRAMHTGSMIRRYIYRGRSLQSSICGRLSEWKYYFPTEIVSDCHIR